MFEINRNVVYVKGAVNGAIYNFNTGKVFSVNQTACSIIEAYIDDSLPLAGNEYLELLRDNLLISSSYIPVRFIPCLDDSVQLDMAWIEITQKCNLKCLHCYEGDTHYAVDKALDLNKWLEIIDELAALHINRLIIIGGEPCCHSQIQEIIKYATQYSFEITLFTNATLLSKDLMRLLITKKLKVKVSIYGHCASIHDQITGVNGSFEKMLRNVKYLIASKIPVYAAVIIMKENQDYVNQIFNFIHFVGMKCKRYDVIRQVRGGAQFCHTPTNKDVIKKVYMTDPNFKADKALFERNAAKNSCWYGKITITENGDVFPCEFDREYIYGNVIESSIYDIISSEKTRARWFLDFAKIDGCRDCEYRFACHDCRPLAYSICGSLENKNPRCCYDVYSGEWRKDI